MMFLFPVCCVLGVVCASGIILAHLHDVRDILQNQINHLRGELFTASTYAAETRKRLVLLQETVEENEQGRTVAAAAPKADSVEQRLQRVEVQTDYLSAFMNCVGSDGRKLYAQMRDDLATLTEEHATVEASDDQ